MERRNFDGLSLHLKSVADHAEGDTAGYSRDLRTLQSLIDALGRADLPAVVALVTDDVRLEILAPPGFPFVLHAHGAEPFRRALDHNFSAVTDQRPHIRGISREGPDCIALTGQETGTLRATGVAYAIEFVQRFTFRDGRVAAVQIVAALVKAPAGR